MPALAKTDFTLTVLDTFRGGKYKFVFGTLAFGDGSLTYPNDGVPLPDIGKFGFAVTMRALLIFGVDSTAGSTADYRLRYDKTNHKLLMYEEEATAAGGPLLECDTSEAPAVRTYDFLAVGY